MRTTATDVRKGLRFAVVGLATAIIYFVLLGVLLRYTRLDYRWAVTIAYAVAVSFHFTANRRYTFEAHDTPAGRQALRYLGLLAINYVVMLGVVTGLVDIFAVSAFLGGCVAVIVTAAVGFLLARFWVFRVG